MSLPVYVDAYAGYKPNERPRQFLLDEDIYEIAAVLDQWYEPAATYFKSPKYGREDVFAPIR